jgi:hypothetical protein
MELAMQSMRTGSPSCSNAIATDGSPRADRHSDHPCPGVAPEKPVGDKCDLFAIPWAGSPLGMPACRRYFLLN